MILAEKILNLRKKNGWSQEELARQLGVSRQSVSKWESAQAIPDLERILDLGNLFGVSTDFLIKDELEFEDLPSTQQAQLPVETGRARRYVSMEEANAFLSMKVHSAGRIAAGVSLCILSPTFLLVMLAIASASHTLPWMTPAVGTAIGMSALLVLVAAGVAVILMATLPLKRFSFLETELIETAYGVRGMVKNRSDQYQATRTRNMVIGVGICIVAAMPIILTSLWEGNGHPEIIIYATTLTLILVAGGVNLLVRSAIINGAYEQLLEEGDYAPEEKVRRPLLSQISGVYWLLVVAVYLAYSFGWNAWDTSWVIWPVAAISYAVVLAVVSLASRRGK